MVDKPKQLQVFKPSANPVSSFSSIFQKQSLFSSYLEKLSNNYLDSSKQSSNLEEAILRVQENLHTDVFISSLNTHQQSALKNTQAIIGYLSEKLFLFAQNYKTPINKLSLALEPKHLGNVELNFTQIGKDFYLQITSNPEALRILAQNSIALREELKRVGFSKVEINFLQNSQKNLAVMQKWNENSLQDSQNIVNPQECRITLSIYA